MATQQLSFVHGDFSIYFDFDTTWSNNVIADVWRSSQRIQTLTLPLPKDTSLIELKNLSDAIRAEVCGTTDFEEIVKFPMIQLIKFLRANLTVIGPKIRTSEQQQIGDLKKEVIALRARLEYSQRQLGYALEDKQNYSSRVSELNEQNDKIIAILRQY